jgi:phytoene dehydrogenase-like protein
MPIVHAFPVTTALSVCAMPVKTPLRGLLLCSQQVAPGLGVEGQLLAAASVAHVVRRGDRAREWLRRRLWTKVEI